MCKLLALSSKCWFSGVSKACRLPTPDKCRWGYCRCRIPGEGEPAPWSHSVYLHRTGNTFQKHLRYRGGWWPYTWPIFWLRVRWDRGKVEIYPGLSDPCWHLEGGAALFSHQGKWHFWRPFPPLTHPLASTKDVKNPSLVFLSSGGFSLPFLSASLPPPGDLPLTHLPQNECL